MKTRFGFTISLFVFANLVVSSASQASDSDDASETKNAIPGVIERALVQSPHVPCTNSHLAEKVAYCTSEQPCRMEFNLDIDENGDVMCATLTSTHPRFEKMLFHRPAMRVMFSAKFSPSDDVTVGQKFHFDITQSNVAPACKLVPMERHVVNCK